MLTGALLLDFFLDAMVVDGRSSWSTAQLWSTTVGHSFSVAASSGGILQVGRVAVETVSSVIELSQATTVGVSVYFSSAAGASGRGAMADTGLTMDSELFVWTIILYSALDGA